MSEKKVNSTDEKEVKNSESKKDRKADVTKKSAKAEEKPPKPKDEKAMRELIREKVKGINESFEQMGGELWKRKLKKERYGRTAAIGMCIGLLPLIRLFFIQNLNLQELVNMFANPLVWAGIITLFLSYGYYKVYYEKAKEKYDNLREEVMSKMWIDFCDCWSVCNHKEQFMSLMKKLDVNLYWK